MLRTLTAGLVLIALSVPSAVQAQNNYDAQWMWFGAGNPAEHAPAGKVWFRRQVRSDQPSTGAARILCDDHFVLWVNGQRVGEGGGDKLFRFNLNGIVGRGPNVIAIEATNKGGKAGLFVDGEVRTQQGQYIPFDSGPEWVATTEPPQGTAWLKPDFKADGWKTVKVIGPHDTSPWKHIVLKDTYLDRFALAPGFEIERIAEPDLVGSIVAITWGHRGRLIASRERGPILNVIDKDGDGKYDTVVEYSNAVTNCQGLCVVGDDLYAVGDGPADTGLYRLPDRNHDDRADDVQLIHKYHGGMGEHGPHDVVFGPDGWLYNNSGNHAGILSPPTEQGIGDGLEPNSPVRAVYEGHLLRPKFEDASGHARGIKSPGGTIWRFTPDGQKWWLEVAGFRNEYDFAFHSSGELFTFDSDMEWDVGMPWYRPVRVCHCPPGAEFGWRSGCAKWPPFYLDSLPATVDVGRGSPTGVVFYEHRQFPEKYRGSFIVCDWSMGRIMAVLLKPNGATFTGEFENLVTGNPLNVSDIEVAADGSLIFSTGGRNTEGGIYRVTYAEGDKTPATAQTVAELLDLPQFQAAWARETARSVKEKAGDAWEPRLVEAARTGSPAQKIRALTLLNQIGPKPGTDLLVELSADDDASVRAFAVHLLGDHDGSNVQQALTRALGDESPVVERRACEAFVRSGIEAPVEPLLSVLGSDDRFVRYEARLALERVPVEKWRSQVLAAENPHVVTHGLLTMFRLGKEALPPEKALQIEADLLHGKRGSLTRTQKLETLRMIELSLLDGGRDEALGGIGQKLLHEFPTGDQAVDMESARLIAVLQMKQGVEGLMAVLEHEDSQGQQIHYALCLRYCQVGWNYDLKRRLLDWYNGTQTWEGGHSFAPYLANIVGATLQYYRPEERKQLLLDWKQRPFATAVLISNSGPENVEDFEGVLSAILDAPLKPEERPQRDMLISSIIDSLGRRASPNVQRILREMYDAFPDRRDQLARVLANHPNRNNWPYLVRTLTFGEQTTLQLCIRGLLNAVDRKQAPDQLTPDEVRTIILTALKLGPGPGQNAVTLLSRLTHSAPNAGDGFEAAVAHYQDWYHDKYPDAPPAVLPKEDLKQAKYTYDQLFRFLERTPQGRQGDPERGRVVFENAKCVKCHRFENKGENVGPDLTSVRRRFQRKEIIESLVYPSQVISDQYRMVTVVTTDGLVHNGMPVPGQQDPDKLVLLLSDATTLQVPKNKIAQLLPSKTSVMPVGTLKDLTLEQIADLFAFLETSKFNAAEPPKAPAGK